MTRVATFLLAFAALPLLLPVSGFADILYLEGGGRVEGVVTDLGEKVQVAALNGAVLVRKSEILDVQKTPYITEIYAEKRSRIDDGKADEHYRLAMWCRRNGLEKHVRPHLDRALELDPDHANTRATLGQVQWKGVWLSREDALSASMAERGFIRYRGRWYTEAGLLAWLDARREELKIEARVEQRKAEREALARKALEEEERIKLLVAERKAVEDALAAAQQVRRERDQLLQQNQDLIDLMRDWSWNSGWYAGWGIYGGWSGIGWMGRRVCRQPVYPTPYRGAPGFSCRRGSVGVRGAFR